MFRKWSPLCNPLLDSIDLKFAQWLFQRRRRHDRIRIGSLDPFDEMTCHGRGERDRGFARLSASKRGLTYVQAQATFASRCIRTVAMQTVLGEYRLDVALKVDCCLRQPALV
jgi:hypothetical protein